MKLLTKYLIIVIFTVALVMRLVNTPQSVPPSINWDEASLGYNAYSILKTGKDEWGKFLPLTFEAFGDYKLPGYIYTLVPFVAIYGLSEFSVRFPSIIFGSLSVIFLYLIVLELGNQKKWALLSASLLTISPWHFFLSRIALEANLAVSFFMIGFYFLVRGLKKQTFLLPASLFLGLSIFTYNSARIFVPLFLMSFLIIFWKQLKLSKLSILATILFGVFLIAGFYLAVFQDSSARYYWVRIVDEGAISYLDQSRNNSALPEIVTKLVYNRPTYFIYNFIINYSKHFSLQFLALSGGSNYQFSLQNMGLIYLAELPFLLFGLAKLLKTKVGWVFILWFIIAPIPSALTREAPHALRSIFMLGSIQVITAFGLINAFNLLRNKKVLQIALTTAFCLSIFTGAAIYYKKYFTEYSNEYSKSWQYGYEEVIGKVNSYSGKYPKIYFTKFYGEPHIFYLFFSKYDPKTFQNNPTLARDSHANWRWVDQLDKIYFINDWEMVEKMKQEKNALVIASPDNVPENSRKLETIYFLDGSIAFEIVEI